ncbi:hypothetical protein [Succinivibrio dextrinosolvens]|uniref:hypothetical protein n=1 Tax=Succinivibrio dextrinosolvens TaxID=83771 RepID=UPI00241F6A37|nr:hypothetical protein [Succinivibrio dextrinosolvens]MBE6423031.1 hypothetical protein [Succinivibrio dextrinosolvens]
MHSRIFTVGHDSEISELSLWDIAIKFDGGIEYIVEEEGKSFDASVDWFCSYLKQNNVKLNRNGNTLKIDKDSFIDFRVKEKRDGIASYLAGINSLDKEKQFKAYKGLAHILSQTEKGGFLFYSEENGMTSLDDLLSDYANDDGDIELDLAQSFDYHF